MDSQTTTQPNNGQQLQIPPDSRAYLENLLEDSGAVLTPELKESVIIDLYNRLEKKLIADAIENMKPEDVEVFTNLIQTSQNYDQINQFIQTHLPNAQEVFVQSLVDFRTYFLAGTMQANPDTKPAAEPEKQAGS